MTKTKKQTELEKRRNTEYEKWRQLSTLSTAYDRSDLIISKKQKITMRKRMIASRKKTIDLEKQIDKIKKKKQ